MPTGNGGGNREATEEASDEEGGPPSVAQLALKGILRQGVFGESKSFSSSSIVMTPPQIVKPDGKVHYWSISSGLVKNTSSPSGVSANSFYAGVQYEEIISGQQSNSTAFDYALTGNALSMIDMQGPGHTGKVTGKTIMTETPFAFAFQMVFWPNITDRQALQ